MARQPILPSSAADPTGQDRRERAAINDFASRMSVIQRGMLRILDKQEYTVVTINSAQMQANETVYRFRLDETILANINAEIALLIDTILLEGGMENLWFLAAYVEPAYRQGTAQSWTNLSVQSELYAASKPTLESILLSEPYRRRIGLLKAREFEEMRGLSSRMKTDLGNTLTRGMVAGENPRKIAKDIEARIGVSKSRANLIARTEITNALRQARMAEADDASENLGITSKQMHISAFSPTTRIEHAKRHGKLFTTQEQRAWWSLSKNVCNCKCSTIEVLVDEKGEPLTPSIIERALRTKQTKLKK